MNQQAPFPNRYVVRLVAFANAKACCICYKPTATVLVAENKVDFFYVCASHLKDTNFSGPIYSDEYKEMNSEKLSLEKKIEDLSKELESVKPYNWNKLVSGLSIFEKKEKEEDKEKGKEGEDKKKEGKNKPENKEDKYTSLEQEIGQLRRKLKETSSNLDNYEFKNYNLNKDIYKMRIQNYIKAKHQQKRNQEISKSGFFPSVPSNKVGE